MEVYQNKLLCGEETFLDLIKGQNLVKANGSVKKCDEVLSGKKLIILYFSANWCQACTEFTPTLRDFYDYVSSRGVEIIFVSSDGSPEEMFRYMKNSHGNWYAVQYGSDLAKKLTQKYDVWGIQCSSGLVVLSENGSIITKN
jgi:nucleoredoxin